MSKSIRDNSSPEFFCVGNVVHIVPPAAAGPVRASTMTSQQAELVERWLDEQKKHRAKGKEVDRADKPEQEKEMERIPPATFNFKAFLRVMSMNLCCTMFGFNIVMSYLIKSSPGGMSILDQELNWIISIPVVSTPFFHGNCRGTNNGRLACLFFGSSHVLVSHGVDHGKAAIAFLISSQKHS